MIQSDLIPDQIDNRANADIHHCVPGLLIPIILLSEQKQTPSHPTWAVEWAELLGTSCHRCACHRWEGSKREGAPHRNYLAPACVLESAGRVSNRMRHWRT